MFQTACMAGYVLNSFVSRKLSQRLPCQFYLHGSLYHVNAALEPNCEKVGWSTTLLTVINSFNKPLLEQIAKFVQENLS